MENINKINFGDDKFNKKENEHYNNIKLTNNNIEDSNKSGTTKDDFKSNNDINLSSDNYDYKPNSDKNSFPLLFK